MVDEHNILPLTLMFGMHNVKLGIFWWKYSVFIFFKTHICSQYSHGTTPYD